MPGGAAACIVVLGVVSINQWSDGVHVVLASGIGPAAAEYSFLSPPAQQWVLLICRRHTDLVILEATVLAPAGCEWSVVILRGGVVVLPCW